MYSKSDKAIRKQIGERLKQLRLRQNTTQQQLADATTLSLNTIKSLETGKGKISSLIAVLRELGQLEQLNNFIPEPEISPLQLARQKGHVRERATGIRSKESQSQHQFEGISENKAEKNAEKNGDREEW